MLQDPNPIDPKLDGEIVLTLNGEKLPFPASAIPGLLVAYVAALRAEYYAGVDAARGADFNKVFGEEVNHALRDRDEIVDWMGNNMDVHDSPVAGIAVTYTRSAPTPPAGQ